MSPGRHLRFPLERDAVFAAPDVFDGVAAWFAEQAGLSCIYMTGAVTSLSLRYPEPGLLSITELVDKPMVITRTVGVPLITYADTGYGNEINVTRTVQEYECAGLAGMHLEDQVSPKRCRHLDGRKLGPHEEFVAKIRAAVAVRTDPNFLIIARTDARVALGWMMP